MDCRNEVPRWDLSSLIGAYVDLCIAYLLLCCSALTFLASNFLSFFSLRLPCPQIHGFLVEAPPHVISGVQMSVLNRFPFWIDRGLIGREERKEEHGPLGKEDVLMIHGKEEDEETDARKIRRRGGSRARMRGCEVEKMRSLSVSSSENSLPFLQLGWSSPTNSSDQIQSRGHYSAPGDMEDPEHNCSTDNFREGVDGKVEGVETNDLRGSERSEAETIKILEHALEVEQTARSALYRELEKERSCASTAAEEAMAMIERLQMEKATIEMNARQYQRMIEEKEAFDEEEMEILKEIVVRRERELYVLGEEFELLRQLTTSSSAGENSAQQVFDGKHFEMGNMKQERISYSSLGLEGNSLTMLQQISKSNITKDSISYENEISSVLHVGGERSESFDCHQNELRVSGDEESLEFQEKGIVSVDIYTSNVQASGSKVNNASCPLVRSVKSTGNDLTQATPFVASGGGGMNSSSNLATQVHTLDVHVIDDKSSLIRDGNGKQRISRMGSDSVHSHDSYFSSDPFEVSNTEIYSDNSSSSWVPGEEQSIRRFISDSECLLRSLEASPLNPSGRSMALVDRERVKLEKEVETLRKRLRNVQEGREKLNLSVEQILKRKENAQLQLLQEITFELQQIKQQSSPAKTTRHASLPPSSSKSNSRKRQSRSDSVGVDGGK